MDRERTGNQVEDTVRDASEADEPPVEEGETGVGQTRRLGGDAGAAQAAVAGTGQATGVASAREGEVPEPPENRRLPDSPDPDEGEPHERLRM